MFNLFIILGGDVEMSSIKIKKITRQQLPESVKVYDVVNAKPMHNFIVSTDSDNFVVMHNCGLLDEI